mgnify:FL=1
MLVGRLAGSIIDGYGGIAPCRLGGERAFVGGSGETYDGGRRLEDAYQDCRGQSGTSEELEAVKGRLGNYDANRKDLELKIRELKYELNYQMKEFETAEKHLDEDYQKLAESNEVKIEALSAKLAELTEFLDNQKDSFFNWLSEHKRWEQTIGQVCDERLLYGKEFTAEVGEGDTFYGIRFTSGFTGMSRPRRIT